MPVESSIGENSIREFLSALSAGTPEPAGGAAAALMASMGAALLSMTCHLTIGRGLASHQDEAIDAVGREAADLRSLALELADRDITAYRAVLRARRLPRGATAEKAERGVRVQEALHGATEVPLQIASLAARVIELCVQVHEVANPNVSSDLAVGALAARTALESAALSARTNLAHITDAAFRATAGARLHAALASSPRAAAVVAHAQARA